MFTCNHYLTCRLPLPDSLWTHELKARHVILCGALPEVKQPLLLKVISGHHQLANLLVGDAVLITVVVCPLHTLTIHGIEFLVQSEIIIQVTRSSLTNQRKVFRSRDLY